MMENANVLIWGFGLVILFISGVFGPGFQLIPLFAAVNVLAAVSLVSIATKWWQIVLVALAIVLGQWLAYLMIFDRDIVSMMMPLGFAIAIGALMGLVYLPVGKMLPKKYGAFSMERGGLYIFILPICFTTVFAILVLISPAGSWANYAYFTIYFNDFHQIASLFGLDGINFALAWGVSLVHVIFVNPWLKSLVQPVAGTDNLNESLVENGEGSVSVTKGSHSWLKKNVFIYIVTLSILFIYGAGRQLNEYNKFFQTAIEDWEQDRFNVVCLAAYESDSDFNNIISVTENTAKQQMFINDDFNSFEQPNFVLWSETAVHIYNDTQEALLISEMTRIANETGALIGIGYLKRIEPRDGYDLHNLFALISDKGVLFTYQKVNPVVGVETTVEPGSGAVDPVETPYGRIGAAICFDFDFPAFIHKASKGADIMLQPGWDWSAIGKTHSRMAATRALENGVTVIRCSSGGVSGVYSPYGEVIMETTLGTSDDVDFGRTTKAYMAQVPIVERVPTLYSYIEGTLGYLCIAAWISMIILSMLTERMLEKMPKLKYMLS